MKPQNFSLGYPFRFKKNVYTDLIEEQAHVWIDSYTSLPEDERLKYKKSHFGFNRHANYGTQGVYSSTNIPGARVRGKTWTDAQGNFYLYGGTDLMKYLQMKDI